MYMSQEMPNLRRFLARFWLCDNQMTIILKVYIISYNLCIGEISIEKFGASFASTGKKKKSQVISKRSPITFSISYWNFNDCISPCWHCSARLNLVAYTHLRSAPGSISHDWKSQKPNSCSASFLTMDLQLKLRMVCSPSFFNVYTNVWYWLNTWRTCWRDRWGTAGPECRWVYFNHIWEDF